MNAQAPEVDEVTALRAKVAARADAAEALAIEAMVTGRAMVEEMATALRQHRAALAAAHRILRRHSEAIDAMEEGREAEEGASE